MRYLSFLLVLALLTNIFVSETCFAALLDPINPATETVDGQVYNFSENIALGKTREESSAITQWHLIGSYKWHILYGPPHQIGTYVIYCKFPISGLDITKIKKVEFVCGKMADESYKSLDAQVTLHEIHTNDWHPYEIETNPAAQPSYNKTPFAAGIKFNSPYSTWKNPSTDEHPPAIYGEERNEVIDVTDFIFQKRAQGEDYVSIMMSQTHNSKSIWFRTVQHLMVHTIDGVVDLPSVSFGDNVPSTVEVGESIPVSVSATKGTNDIASVDFYLNYIKLDGVVNNGDGSYALPAINTGGNYILSAIATDTQGYKSAPIFANIKAMVTVEKVNPPGPYIYPAKEAKARLGGGSYDTPYWYFIESGTGGRVDFLRYNISGIDLSTVKKVVWAARFGVNHPLCKDSSGNYIDKPVDGAIKLYEVKNSDWTAESVILSTPEYNKKEFAISQYFNYDKTRNPEDPPRAIIDPAISTDYANSYNETIDVTDFFIKKKLENSTNMDFMVGLTTGGEGYAWLSPKSALVIYTSNNNRPTITGVSVDEIVPVNTSIPLSGTIKDTDGFIESVTATIDGTQIAVNNFTNGATQYELDCTIPALSEGTHKFVLETADNIGAKTYYTKEFTVTNLSFGEILFAQTAQNQIKASVSVSNIGQEDTNTVLVVALYSPTGGMSVAAADSKTIIAGQNKLLEANIDLPATADQCRQAGYTLRAFVWDSLGNMKMHLLKDYENFGL